MWIDKVKEHKDKLRSLIEKYHPSSMKGKPLKITAPNAERAAASIRRTIKRTDPLSSFDAALAAEDVATLRDILSETWFGVPESTACWSVPGFAECVELLDE